MTTVFITELIRQKFECYFFFSTLFASWYHRDLFYAYPFSYCDGKRISALLLTFIDWLEHLIYLHDSRENCCLLKACYYQNSLMLAKDQFANIL